MKYRVIPRLKKDFYVSPNLHSVFFEFMDYVIYDGIWVGKDSDIPNIDGIRRDVVEGCREMGVGCMRWPGGCCADHYHWKNGIGKVREDRTYPLALPLHETWCNDFGTDEFLHLCELVGAEPILTVNTATGTPEEFLDWYEYVNGPVTTKYGRMRAENGHPEPYNVKYWGIGNTDENVWHIDFNNPEAYAQTFMKYRTVLRKERDSIYWIGLGLSTRHKLPGWTGQMLNHVTRHQKDKGPDALSVHHYLGGAKQGGALCGGDVEYSDEAYYALLDLLERYQYDIDLHRVTIREHTNPKYPTKICFDEWGAWHPEATIENYQRQRQTLRDAIFAALSLHIFYRNSDVVAFAMETQVTNLLQSLFETDGEKCYRTPTFYAMKLLYPHTGQYLIHALPDDVDENLDTVATMSENGESMTISIVNRHISEDKKISLAMADGEWSVTDARILTADDVHVYNTYDDPNAICDREFALTDLQEMTVPAHSIVRICLQRK